MEGMITILVIVGIIVVAIFAMGMVFAKLYTRSSKETSFVRTGAGGQKVIMNGGALVLPVFHEIIPVNMNTLRLEVKRANDQALITRDRMRVDVTAEFYVRVKPSEDSIANSAQTLGMKTMEPEELKKLIEGKFVDALRAVAAEMEMTDLHEQRVDFVQKVQQVVSEDLLKNGLELEAVSLTGLDQTSKEFFNPNNAFDAEGLTKLTEEIQARRKIRNEIEQDTDVAVAEKNLEAEQKKLEIMRKEEFAKMQQEREIEIKRADQNSEIAKEQSGKEKEAEQAKIEAEQQVATSKIDAEKLIEQGRIEKDRELKEREIAKIKSIELAEQDRAIVIAEKSKEKSEAQALADKARSLAVKEEEAVVTVRETEIAERQKAVELVEAKKLAEREAIKIKVAAETEKQAALDKAESVKIIANAEAEKERIKAQANADAEIMKAEAAEKSYAVEATGTLGLNESHNILSEDQVAMQIKLSLIEKLPEIIKESVKPMESIDGIKIFQIDGLNGGSSSGGTTIEGGSSSLSDQLVNSALRYRGQAPLVDSLLADIGLKAGDINGMTSQLTGNEPPEKDAGEEKKE